MCQQHLENEKMNGQMGIVLEQPRKPNWSAKSEILMECKAQQGSELEAPVTGEGTQVSGGVENWRTSLNICTDSVPSLANQTSKYLSFFTLAGERILFYRNLKQGVATLVKKE